MVCVFCGMIATSIFICWNCNEYKGIMSFEDAAEYMPEDFGYLVEEL